MGEFEQATIGGTVTFSGVCVHSGESSQLTLRAGPANSGILFRRIDLADTVTAEGLLIPADPQLVTQAQLGTRIENAAGVSVSTVEHLMAALAICGIDNVIAEIDGAELPIMDGSASPFVEKILEAGLCKLGEPQRIIPVEVALEERDGDRFIRIEPAPDRLLNVTIDFDDPMIGKQSVSLNLDDGPALLKRVAPARTFCRLPDIEAMRTAGFARGGSLANAIVVDNGRMLNEEGLRDPVEFALHKALDLLGDFHLLGGQVCGHITAYKPGHDLNTRMARRLARNGASRANAGAQSTNVNAPRLTA